MNQLDDMDGLMEAVDWIPVFGPWPEHYGLYATHTGWLQIADWSLQVYQLSDGQQVFDADSVSEAFGDDGSD